MSKTVEFWFELASTYSYPAAMRVEQVARDAGVDVVWKPFLLGPIFQAQGWNDSPFNIYEAKGRYMWRDLARICGRLGLPLRSPSQFPRHTLAAARVALVGAEEAWGADFVRGIYTANFGEDRDISRLEVVGEVLASLGLDAAAEIQRSQADENKQALRRQTEAAVAQGLFGAPSFVARGELFWGNDRLEEAVEWAAG